MSSLACADSTHGVRISSKTRIASLASGTTRVKLTSLVKRKLASLTRSRQTSTNQAATPSTCTRGPTQPLNTHNSRHVPTTASVDCRWNSPPGTISDHRTEKTTEHQSAAHRTATSRTQEQAAPQGSRQHLTKSPCTKTREKSESQAGFNLTRLIGKTGLRRVAPARTVNFQPEDLLVPPTA